VRWDRTTRFYPIIDSDVCAGRGLDPAAVAAGCLKGGARLLQLRVKRGPSGAFLALADAIIALARPYGATVVVNDRIDIAVMSDAGGAHVGQDDLPPAEARALLGTRLLGVSTHDPRQADAALASPADYIAAGPIYSTTTKDTGYDPRGLALLQYAAGRGKPVVAIGGITLETGPAVIAAGAAAVAVITDVLRDDPERRTQAYLAVL
jgi:thiamine-phosphate diphosphorylase